MTESPGGFVFGVQGYEYGTPIPRGITFNVDGTAKVVDHRGNPMKTYVGSHQAVVEQLKEAVPPVDWQKLDWAGWPQLPYSDLAELTTLPPTPLEELAKIPNKALRIDAIKMRREVDAAKVEELEEATV